MLTLPSAFQRTNSPSLCGTYYPLSHCSPFVYVILCPKFSHCPLPRYFLNLSSYCVSCIICAHQHRTLFLIVFKPFMRVKLLQFYPTLCDPMGHSPLGSCVYGILQARILEWVFLHLVPPGKPIIVIYILYLFRLFNNYIFY